MYEGCVSLIAWMAKNPRDCLPRGFSVCEGYLRQKRGRMLASMKPALIRTTAAMMSHATLAPVVARTPTPAAVPPPICPYMVTSKKPMSE